MTETNHEETGGGAAGALKGGAVALVLVVLGLVLWTLARPVTGDRPEMATDQAASDAEVTTAPAAVETQASDAPASAPAATAQAAAPEAQAAPAPATEAAAPDATAAAAAAPEAMTDPAQADLAQVQFDALRAAPDGSVALAGRTDPGAKLDILVDGQVVAQTTADGSGSFASLFDLPPATGPRALSLRVNGADGEARESAESLVLRGHPEAEQVAAADQAAGEPATETPAATPTPPAAPLVATADGARLLAPQSKDLVIDTIAFSAGEAARSEGRGAPEGSDLAAYLDDTLVAEAKPGADGRWALDLPGLTPGAHKLRIDARDASGKVIARAETSFDQPDEIIVASDAGAAKAEAQAVSAAGGAGDAVKVVQIVKGNTLWAIAREVYGDGVLYVRVFDANRDQIRDPDLIYPGQVFTIPAPESAPEPAAQ